jgi:hypothetical protein
MEPERTLQGTHARLWLLAKVLYGPFGEIDDPKRIPHQGDYDRAERARRHQEETLDDALKNTFPASDPISIAQPIPPAADHDRVET